MEIGGVCVVSILEKRLIVASLAVSNACPKKQHLRHAVQLTVNRRSEYTPGKRQVLITGEAGK
jgi:hypothetical protein